jgi:inorganic phosphate transporter, PiT family
MTQETGVVFALAVLLVYVYAFVGAFTDAENAIATSVGSRVLSPRAAVVLAGGFNLLGGLSGTAVALTIGKGLVDPSALSLITVVAGLVGAMTWSLLTYSLGIPVSETHGLIGGLVGAGIATAGVGVIQWQGCRRRWSPSSPRLRLASSAARPSSSPSTGRSTRNREDG